MIIYQRQIPKKEILSVKEIRSFTPNDYLRNERERRSWTRAYMADQLGLADPKTIGRWERGVASPNSYFRQKLCELFGKTAQELGLTWQMRDARQEEDQRPLSILQETLFSLPPDFLYDPATPSTFAGNVNLIGRDKLLRKLKQCLCATKPPVYTALHGLPGVGKTMLAAVLAYDPEIRTHFHDGVLWAKLGPNPDIPGVLSRWGTLLNIPVAQMNHWTTYEERLEAISTAINSQRVLFVIDDVWNIGDALSCNLGGPNCAYLITTRLPSVALQFSLYESFLLSELNTNDGLALLSCFVPKLVSSEMSVARELVQIAGGSPLALTLMGKYLQRQSYSNQPRRVEAALKGLHDAKERLQLTEPQAALERSPSLPVGSPLSLQAVIEVSDRQLDENTRYTLYALSIFPAKPNSFTEEAALAVCAMPVKTLDTLIDAGLLESYSPGRYTLHQIIVDYARVKHRNKSAEERLLVYMDSYIQQHPMDYEMLQSETNNILTTLDIAYKLQMRSELVRISCVFASFLYMHSSYTLAEELLTRASEVAMTLGEDRGFINTLFSFMRITHKQTDRTKVSEYLKDGFNLASRHKDITFLSILLRRLTVIIAQQGSYTQAEMYYQEKLTLARQCHLHERINCFLVDLGLLMSLQGNYVQAKAYLQEALVLARQQDFCKAEVAIFAVLGWVVTEQRNYKQAEIYLKEGLTRARQMNCHELIAGLLWMLSTIASHQGNYAQAEADLKEGLELGHQLGYITVIDDLLQKQNTVEAKRKNTALVRYLQISPR